MMLKISTAESDPSCSILVSVSKSKFCLTNFLNLKCLGDKKEPENNEIEPPPVIDNEDKDDIDEEEDPTPPPPDPEPVEP